MVIWWYVAIESQLILFWKLISIHFPKWDIFTNISVGEKFSKIDLTQAYHQMELNEVSKKTFTDQQICKFVLHF